MIACKLGAKHVYAIEPLPLVEMGRAFAAANGYADRITFIKDISNRVELPEKADVILGDIRGQYALYQHIISTFADAYQRLLKPGGILLPKRDRLFVTLLDAPELYHEGILNPWMENNFDLNLETGFSFQANAPIYKKDLSKSRTGSASGSVVGDRRIWHPHRPEFLEHCEHCC